MPEVLPELGALTAALFLLLIAAALWVLIQLLDNSLGQLPVVGSWIKSNISNALNDARNAVLRAAGASWHAAVQMFRWMEAFIRAVGDAIFSGLVQTYLFAANLYSVTLPNLENRLALTASQWFSTAESYALGLYHSAVNYVNTQVTRALAIAAADTAVVEHDARVLFDTATADIANALVSAEHYAANLVANASTSLQADILAAENLAIGDINDLERSTQAAINQLFADVTSGVATAESVAAARLAAVQAGIYTDLETWGLQAVRDAWPDVQGDVQALRGVLGQDFPWLNDLLGVLGGVGAAGLLGALIQSMAGAHAITRLATDCIVPNCRNLSGLGNDLSNLLSTASTAAMLAWLIFAVTDPSGWAAETDAAAGGVAATLAQDAARLFRGA